MEIDPNSSQHYNDNDPNKNQLRISRETIKVDAIKFIAIFTAAILISLVNLNIGAFFVSILLYLPNIIAAILSWICSKTDKNWYIQCNSIILIIFAVYFGLFSIFFITAFAIALTKVLTDGCADDNICNIWGWLYAIWLIIEGLLLTLTCAHTIYAVGHSDKLKDLLSSDMQEFQEPLLGSTRYSNNPQQEYSWR